MLPGKSALKRSYTLVVSFLTAGMHLLGMKNLIIRIPLFAEYLSALWIQLITGLISENKKLSF
jgi:hypothetical protein